MLILFVFDFQAKTTKKLVLRLEWSKCKRRQRVPIKRTKLFELEGDKKRKGQMIQFKKPRECVRNLDLRVQVHPGELWVSKQWVHIVVEASKLAGAKGDVPKICGFVHPLHQC